MQLYIIINIEGIIIRRIKGIQWMQLYIYNYTKSNKQYINDSFAIESQGHIIILSKINKEN